MDVVTTCSVQTRGSIERSTHFGSRGLFDAPETTARPSAGSWRELVGAHSVLTPELAVWELSCSSDFLLGHAVDAHGTRAYPVFGAFDRSMKDSWSCTGSQ